MILRLGLRIADMGWLRGNRLLGELSGVEIQIFLVLKLIR